MIYRQGRNYENLNKMIYRGTGKFDTPRLVPEACNADSFIGFNYAKSCKDPQHKGVHFFIDDYQFTRLWTNPDAYLDMLRAFKCVFYTGFQHIHRFPEGRPNLESLSQALARRVLAEQRNHRYSDDLMERREQF